MWGRLVMAWEQVLQLVDEALDVAWQGYVDISLLVVPFNGDSTVEAAVPIVRNFVEVFERGDEVMGVLLANSLDAEVVDD